MRNRNKKRISWKKRLINENKKTTPSGRLKKRLPQIIVESFSVPTFIIKDNLFITHWNKACENITGTLADEVIGTQKQWKTFYSEERPVMSDLIVNEASEEEIARVYGDRCQKSNDAEITSTTRVW
jgi:PAS domain S-box-containing protein